MRDATGSGRVATAAWLLPASALLAWAVADVLGALRGFEPSGSVLYLFYGVPYLAFAAVGGLIIRDRRASRIGWLLCGIGVLQGVAVASGELAGLLARAPAAGELASWLIVATVPVPIASSVLIPALLVVFPDGRLPSPRWQWFLGFVAASGPHSGRGRDPQQRLRLGRGGLRAARRHRGAGRRRGHRDRGPAPPALRRRPRDQPGSGLRLARRAGHRPLRGAGGGDRCAAGPPFQPRPAAVAGRHHRGRAGVVAAVRWRCQMVCVRRFVVCPASPTRFGGVRAAEHLRTVLTGMGARVTAGPTVATAHERLDTTGLVDELGRQLISALGEVVGDEQAAVPA